QAAADGAGGGNGLYRYGASSSFPDASYGATNYWVDVVFMTALPDLPPTVTSTSPAAGTTGVSPSAIVTATFSELLDASTITTSTFELRNAAGTLVPAATTYV